MIEVKPAEEGAPKTERTENPIPEQNPEQDNSSQPTNKSKVEKAVQELDSALEEAKAKGIEVDPDGNVRVITEEEGEKQEEEQEQQKEEEEKQEENK